MIVNGISASPTECTRPSTAATQIPNSSGGARERRVDLGHGALVDVPVAAVRVVDERPDGALGQEAPVET